MHLIFDKTIFNYKKATIVFSDEKQCKVFGMIVKAWTPPLGPTPLHLFFTLSGSVGASFTRPTLIDSDFFLLIDCDQKWLKVALFAIILGRDHEVNLEWFDTSFILWPIRFSCPVAVWCSVHNTIPAIHNVVPYCAVIAFIHVYARVKLALRDKPKIWNWIKN